MNNTLKIKIPEGFRAASFDASTGEIKLEEIPKNIRERLQTMDDVYAYNGTTEKEFEKKCLAAELTPDEIGYRNEKLIVYAYNEGKEADWEDGTYKRYPIFKMPTPSGARFAFHDCDRWSSDSGVGSRLVFVGPESYDNMIDAVTKFLPQYEQSRTS
jgi:hypothetical protein